MSLGDGAIVLASIPLAAVLAWTAGRAEDRMRGRPSMPPRRKYGRKQ